MDYSEHRVLVVGAAGLDMKVRPLKTPVSLGHSNPGEIRWGWGGVARNIAENLARLGAEVHLITAVGNDKWGNDLLHQLAELGVNTDDCIISDKYSTASGSDISDETANTYIQYQIRLYTSDIDTVTTPKLFRSDEPYAVKISLGYGATAETSIDF